MSVASADDRRAQSSDPRDGSPVRPTADEPCLKRQARSQFDGWADTYDRSLLNHFLFKPAYLLMLEEIRRWWSARGRGFRQLDVGCGTASFGRLLLCSDLPVHVTGLDMSALMCKTASAKLVHCAPPDTHAFVTSDSEHLPFADATFDVVTCANSFHHYPNQQAVVNEMARVLKPDGRVILVDGFRDNAVGWFVFDVVIGRIEPGVRHAPWSRMRDYFSGAGLHNVRQRKSSLLFPLLMTSGTK